MTLRFLARSAVLTGLVAALAVSAASLATPARADGATSRPAAGVAVLGSPGR